MGKTYARIKLGKEQQTFLPLLIAKTFVDKRYKLINPAEKNFIRLPHCNSFGGIRS